MVYGVKSPGKQMPEIMGEYLFRVNACTLAQGFHISPDVAAVKRAARPGSKHCAAGFALFTQIDRQQLA